MIALDFSGIDLRLKKESDKTFIFDPVRKRWVIFTPEEHIRQYMISYLTHVMHYPAGLISIEKRVLVGTLNKRFDAVVYDHNHKPWMLIECKAPAVEISAKTLQQLLSYQGTVQCNYWLLTNGRQTFCADACDPQQISWLNTLPPYNF